MALRDAIEEVRYRMDKMDLLRRKYKVLANRLDEFSLRVCAAADAELLGRGGVAQVAEASGLSRTTVYAGLRELKDAQAPDIGDQKTRGRSRRADEERIQLVYVVQHLLHGGIDRKRQAKVGHPRFGGSNIGVTGCGRLKEVS